MKLWIKILAGATPAAAFLLLSLLLLLHLHRRNRQQQIITPQSLPQPTTATTKFGNIHSGINKFHLSYKSGSNARKSLRFHNLNHHNHHSPANSPPVNFTWDDNPRLIADSVETGWAGFAFSASAGDTAETGWEITSGSPEFIQTVRLNPGLNSARDEPLFATVRTGLPLPGPALGGAAFPQEAYFEITIVYLQSLKKIQSDMGSKRMKSQENDRTKLIKANSKDQFDSKESVFSSDEGRFGEVNVALGLISSGSTLLGHAKPGTFHGSIGFHSNGSVYLDGRKLVFESEKTRWDSINRVIGCGFEPGKKKVFFTVDSNLAHVIRCTAPAYGSPLFPVMSSDADIMFQVNLGQAPFKYAPANTVRTPNPCFHRVPAGDETAVGFGDSRELFSVSRMEGDWIDRRSKMSNGNSKKNSGLLEDSLDSESDLFEISLQGL